MRKILLLISALLLFGINNSFSATITKSWNNNVVNCNTINDNSGQKYIAKSNYVGWEKASSGSFKCEKHGYYGGAWTGWINKNTTYSCPDNRFVSRIQWSGDRYKIFCKYRDDTPPTETEITPNPSNGSYFVAVNNKTLSFSTSPTGSSIIEINTTLEKYNNKNSSNSLIFNTSNSFTKYNNNLSIVDSDKISKNYRPYTFHIGTVKDEAGNSSNLNKNYFYNVYANNIDMGKSSISSTINLSSGNKVADGNNNNIQLILKDIYSNKILKVTKADNTVIRNVDVNVSYNNELFLDQYKQTGNSAVYIGTTNLNGTDTPNSGIFRNDYDGIYNLGFKVYSPTSNSYSKAKGDFKINNITSKVTNYTASPNFVPGGVEFKFKPIYKLDFKNEGVKKYGFIEGALQGGGIIYSKNGSESTSNENIYLEFGKYDDSTDSNKENTDFNLRLIESGITSTIEEGHKVNIENTTEKTFGNFDFNTKLEQENTSVVSYDLTYLASFMKYEIDSKKVVYPTDIIGKMTYSSGTGTNTNELKGVKILGKTYSKYAKNIFQNQEFDYNTVKGNITKGELKKKIRKKAYNLVNNIDIDYYTSTENNYKELLDNKVIYYKLDGGTIKYENINNNYKAENGKTILIIGGDLIIQKDDLKNNIGIHGVVVLKDLNGKGGNILIDDDVLNINATMYADKSMLAYDLPTNKYLTLDDGIGYFKNQLYIKGSLFSNNTIGGARGNNLKCAYYDAESCDIKKAQKFDLNFIRRYSRYIDDNSTPDDTSDDTIEISEGGEHSIGIPEKYLDYPLIIEYNPLIQITPPSLFSK